MVARQALAEQLTEVVADHEAAVKQPSGSPSARAVPLAREESGPTGEPGRDGRSSGQTHPCEVPARALERGERHRATCAPPGRARRNKDQPARSRACCRLGGRAHSRHRRDRGSGWGTRVILTAEVEDPPAEAAPTVAEEEAPAVAPNPRRWPTRSPSWSRPSPRPRPRPTATVPLAAGDDDRSERGGAEPRPDRTLRPSRRGHLGRDSWPAGSSASDAQRLLPSHVTCLPRALPARTRAGPGAHAADRERARSGGRGPA